MTFPDDYTRKHKITIDPSKIGTDNGATAISNAVVTLIEDHFLGDAFSTANEDGSDLRFTSDKAGQNILNREIELWDNGVPDKAVIHVVMATLSATNNEIWVWYGNATATETCVSNATSPFINHDAVLHMDATTNPNNATHNFSSLPTGFTETTDTLGVGTFDGVFNVETANTANDHYSQIDQDSYDLQGEFTVDIDWDEVTAASPDYRHEIRLRINFSDSVYAQITVDLRGAANYYSSQSTSDAFEYSSLGNVSETSGKIRIERVGATTSCYVFRSAAWTKIKDFTLTTEATGKVQLWIHKDTGDGCHMHLDNLTIISEPHDVAADATFNGKTATGGVVVPSSGVPSVVAGNTHNALDFSSDVLSFGTDSVFAPRYKFTLSLLINPDAPQAWNRIFTREDASNHDYALMTSGEGERLDFFLSGSNYAASTAAIPNFAGNWHHVCVVYDGTQTTASDRVKLYVNGASVSFNMVGGDFPAQLHSGTPNSINTLIGSLYSSTSSSFDGKIDEVRFIADVAKDENWVATEYETLINPSTFVTEVGAAIDFDIIGDGIHADVSAAVTNANAMGLPPQSHLHFTGLEFQAFFWDASNVELRTAYARHNEDTTLSFTEPTMERGYDDGTTTPTTITDLGASTNGMQDFAATSLYWNGYYDKHITVSPNTNYLIHDHELVDMHSCADMRWEKCVNGYDSAPWSKNYNVTGYAGFWLAGYLMAGIRSDSTLSIGCREEAKTIPYGYDLATNALHRNNESTTEIEIKANIPNSGDSFPQPLEIDYKYGLAWTEQVSVDHYELRLQRLTTFNKTSENTRWCPVVLNYTTLNGTLAVGDTVTQVTSGATGKVFYHDTGSKTLALELVTGTFDNTNQVQKDGATSNYVVGGTATHQWEDDGIVISGVGDDAIKSASDYRVLCDYHMSNAIVLFRTFAGRLVARWLKNNSDYSVYEDIEIASAVTLIAGNDGFTGCAQNRGHLQYQDFHIIYYNQSNRLCRKVLTLTNTGTWAQNLGSEEILLSPITPYSNRLSMPICEQKQLGVMYHDSADNKVKVFKFNELLANTLPQPKGNAIYPGSEAVGGFCGEPLTFGDLTFFWWLDRGVIYGNIYDSNGASWKYTAPQRMSGKLNDLHNAIEFIIDDDKYLWLVGGGRDNSTLPGHENQDYYIRKSSYTIDHASFTLDVSGWSNEDPSITAGRGYKGLAVDADGQPWFFWQDLDKVYVKCKHNTHGWGSSVLLFEDAKSSTVFPSDFGYGNRVIPSSHTVVGEKEFTIIISTRKDDESGDASRSVNYWLLKIRPKDLSSLSSADFNANYFLADFLNAKGYSIPVPITIDAYMNDDEYPPMHGDCIITPEYMETYAGWAANTATSLADKIKVNGHSWFAYPGQFDPFNGLSHHTMWGTVNDTGSKLSYVNGRLEFDSNVSGTDQYANLTDLTTALSGDFEATFDFEFFQENIGTPSGGDHYLFMYLRAGAEWVYIARRKLSANGTEAYTINGTTTGASSVYNQQDHTCGRFKITRVGSVIKLFYWKDNQWAWNGSTAGFTASETFTTDADIDITFKQEDGARFHCAIDNFHATTGDGTTSASQPTFPNNPDHYETVVDNDITWMEIAHYAEGQDVEGYYHYQGLVNDESPICFLGRVYDLGDKYTNLERPFLVWSAGKWEYRQNTIPITDIVTGENNETFVVYNGSFDNGSFDDSVIAYNASNDLLTSFQGTEPLINTSEVNTAPLSSYAVNARAGSFSITQQMVAWNEFCGRMNHVFAATMQYRVVNSGTVFFDGMFEGMFLGLK